MSKEIRIIGRKYDYRYSVLLIVFAQLIKDGWLTVDELKGLTEDKINWMSKILAL